jgi:hypothetical protein
LLHRSKKPLYRYCALNGGGAFKHSSQKEVDSLFEKYNCAKLELYGNIVPQIRFHAQDGPMSCVLELCTTANLLY